MYTLQRGLIKVKLINHVFSQFELELEFKFYLTPHPINTSSKSQLYGSLKLLKVYVSGFQKCHSVLHSL